MTPTTEEILAWSDHLGDVPPDPNWDEIHKGMHYDREGREISLRDWAKLHNVNEYVRVGSDEIGPYWVSTVWIGINHRFLGGAPPLIYETMVFKGDESDLDCVRYSTLDQAIEGHRRMVEEVRLFAELD